MIKVFAIEIDISCDRCKCYDIVASGATSIANAKYDVFKQKFKLGWRKVNRKLLCDQCIKELPI